MESGSELKAGRALDELVAEKVMGWKRNTRPGEMPWLSPEPINKISKWFHVPCFSTEIVWAEQILMRYPHWQISAMGGIISACVSGDLQDKAQGKTIAEAICLSALKTSK